MYGYESYTHQLFLFTSWLVSLSVVGCLYLALEIKQLAELLSER